MNEHVIWNELGVLHSNAGAYPQAIRAFQRAIELDACFARAVKNLGSTYKESGDLAQAAKAYLASIPLTDDLDEAIATWEELGRLYSQLQQEDAAKKAYGEAVSLRISGKKNLLAENLTPQASLFTDVKAQPVSDVADNTLAQKDTTKEAPSTEEHSLTEVPLDRISINPQQPRLKIKVDDLVESIREYGIIQPLIVSPNGSDEHYILIAGERRLEAARQLGLATVPVVIRPVTPQQQLEIALTENVQRRRLTSLELAEAYSQLHEEYQLSPEEIAQRVGTSTTVIVNYLRQMTLPEKVKRALDAERIQEDHAIALLELEKTSQQLMLLKKIISENLTVRETETLIKSFKNTLSHYTLQYTPAREEKSTEAPALDAHQANNSLVEEDAQEETEMIELDDFHEKGDDFEKEEPLFSIDESDYQSNPSQRYGEYLLDSEATDIASDVDVEEEPNPESDTEPSAYFLGTKDKKSLKDTLPQTAEFEFEKNTLSEEDLRNQILSYKSVTEQNPKNTKAWSLLGRYHGLLEENTEAITAYLEALALAPSNSHYHYQLGQIYSKENRYEEAIESFKYVLVLDRDNLFAHCALASAYRRLKRQEEAETHIEAASCQMESESDYNRACFESIRGDADQAISFLQKSLESAEVTVEKILNEADFDFITYETSFQALIEEKAQKYPITELDDSYTPIDQVAE